MGQTARFDDHAVSGTPFVIDDGTSRDGELRTRVARQRPFLFTAHPERWGVQGGKVRPLLGKLKVYPGVHGITLSRAGKLRGVRAAIAAKEARGWTVIPQTAVPPAHHDGGEEVSYLYQPEGRPDVTLDIYTRAFPGSARTQCDFERWHEFLDWLVDSGTIPRCPAYVLERMLEAETKKAERAADLAKTVPSAEVRAKHHDACVAAIRAELDERQAAAKPVRRRRASVDLGDAP